MSGEWDELALLARTVRRLSLEMIHRAGSGHPGGSLSATDLLCYLFSRELEHDPGNPSSPGRDRFILSKGHACPALYAIGAEIGFTSHAELDGFRKLNRNLQGHPHSRVTPWVETSTGSLGQGFSVAIGEAIGLRHVGQDARVYVMLGDGELQEGEIWEGAMCAAHYSLGNLCAIVDYNKMQSDDLNERIMGLEPLRAKWEAFNWKVLEIDGHDFGQMAEAFAQARRVKDMPTIVIAHTVKGKGVSYMEGSPLWHGSVKLRDEELEQALGELDLTSGQTR